MPAITIADLENAKLDVDHIAAITTSTAPTATDRLGQTKQTIAGSLAAIAENVNEVQTVRNNAINTEIPDAVAQVTEAVAATYVGQAGDAKEAAEVAQAAAQTAAGVAYAANRIFPTSAAGQAAPALVSGDYFYVNAATSDLLELWTKGASAPANTGKRVPSSVALARVGADRARNERFLNRFDKNSREIVAGFISSTGTITATGSIADGNTFVTPLIGVTPGETLYLSEFLTTGSSGLMATYDANLSVTTASTMASTFVVPAGVFYVRFSLIWRADAYVSSYGAKYYDFGYTADDRTAATASEGFADAFRLENVSLFDTTVYTASPSDLTVSAGVDGVLFTALTTASGYASFKISPDVVNGEKYQLAIDYEVTDLNCTSVEVSSFAFFAGGATNGRIVRAEQVGVRNTLTVKSLTKSGSSVICGIRTIAAGAKINEALPYFSKVLMRRVSVIKYTDSLQNLQSIERVLGVVAGSKKALMASDLQAHQKYTDPKTFQGYNLVRMDSVENTKNLVGRTLSISNSVPSSGFSIGSVLPPAIDGTPGYTYLQAEITLNSLNADYLNLIFRTQGGDDGPTLTRADIGKKKRVQLVRRATALTATNQFLLFATNLLFTNGVAGVGLDGGDPTASITINSLSVYASQSFLPTSYHAAFFDEQHTADVLPDYVKQPVQQLTINAYGDSITEHNYMRFIGCDGYSFAINIYGLRGPVSEVASGPGSGACNTFGVMTDAADIVMPMFGTHDWSRDVPIGAIGTLDKTTYIGAYEAMVRGLIAKYPGKIIIPVSMPPIGRTSTDAEFLFMKTPTGVTVRQYVNALRDLCDFYGLPFVDAYAASGANQLTMTGHPNLYVPGTTSDNTLIDAAGAVTTNATWFTSDFISVSQGKSYGAATRCHFAEYNGSTFVRRTTGLGTKLYLHPSTTHVRISVSKSEVVIAGTAIGVGPSRFWFADQADAYMPDRVHPNEVCQARIAAEVSRVLKPVLDARRMTAAYQNTIYINAD